MRLWRAFLAPGRPRMRELREAHPHARSARGAALVAGGADREEGDPRNAPPAAQAQQRRGRRCCHTRARAGAVGVHPVHEHVAARCARPSAGGTAPRAWARSRRRSRPRCPRGGRAGAAGRAAAARERPPPARGGELAVLALLAVTEAEARLAVASDDGAVPSGAAELVTVEVEQVPVLVRLGADVADDAGTRSRRREPSERSITCVTRMSPLGVVGAARVDDQRAVADVVDRRAERCSTNRPSPRSMTATACGIAWSRSGRS